MSIFGWNAIVLQLRLKIWTWFYLFFTHELTIVSLLQIFKVQHTKFYWSFRHHMEDTKVVLLHWLTCWILLRLRIPHFWTVGKLMLWFIDWIFLYWYHCVTCFWSKYKALSMRLLRFCQLLIIMELLWVLFQRISKMFGSCIVVFINAS